MTADPPISTDIVCEEQIAGVTIYVPPVGFRRAGGSLRVWGIWMGFTAAGVELAALVSAIIAVIVCFHPAHFFADVGWGGYIGLVILWLIAAIFFLIGWNSGNNRTTFAVQDGALFVDQTGPMWSVHREFKKDEIRSIHRSFVEFNDSDGPAPNIHVLIVNVVKDPPRRFLLRRPSRFHELHLFTGRTSAEIDWIADKLNQALGLPPPEPRIPWRWPRRNSA